LPLGLKLYHQFLDAPSRLVDRGSRRCFLLLDARCAPPRPPRPAYPARGRAFALSDDAAHVVVELLDADALGLGGVAPARSD
jgi:hypothetical protein